MTYLNQKQWFYRKELSVDNQFMLWSSYIRPYFQYILPVIKTQAKTLQQKVKTLWKKSLKSTIGIPWRTPNQVLKIFLADFEHIQSKSQHDNNQRIISRLDEEMDNIGIVQDQSYTDAGHISCIPENFKQMLYLQGKTCTCCNRYLSFSQICEHSQVDAEKFLQSLRGHDLIKNVKSFKRKK